MTTVFATSDMHGILPEIAPCDLLLLAGDHEPDFDPLGGPLSGAEFQLDWLDTKFRTWLKDIPAKNVVGIAGNHSFVFEKLRTAVRELHLPWIYLEDSEVTVEGLRIYGTPWVPNLTRWAFYASERALEARAEAIPRGVDILISHGPPYGALDKTCPMFGSCHVGDLALSENIDRIGAKVICFGHVHEGFGQFRHPSGTLLVNASLNNEYYDPINPVVDLSGEFNDYA